MTGRAVNAAAARCITAVGMIAALGVAGWRIGRSLSTTAWSDPDIGWRLVEWRAFAVAVVGSSWWLVSAVTSWRLADSVRRTTRGTDVAPPGVGETIGSPLVLPVPLAAILVATEHWPATLLLLPVAGVLALWWVAELHTSMREVDRWCGELLDPRREVSWRHPSAGPSALGRHDEVVRLHHVLVPRAMVLAAHLALLALPVAVVLLERSGHASVDGWRVSIDGDSQRLLFTVGVVVGATHALGWSWWTVAAALNAARRVRWPVSPLLAPLGHLVAVGAGVGALVAASRVEGDQRVPIIVTGAAVALLAHLAVLGGYRRTAVALGGSSRRWTMAIAAPWTALALTAAAALATSDASVRWSELVLEIGWVACCAIHALSVNLAMSHFDRECAGRRQSAVTDRAVVQFVRSISGVGPVGP